NTQATPPTAKAARKNMASVWTGICLNPRRFGDCLRGVERVGEPRLFAVIARTLPEARPADAGRAMPAEEIALRVFAGQIVHKQVLRNDDVAFHSHDFSDVRDLARSVAQARRLNNHVDGSTDHF